MPEDPSPANATHDLQFTTAESSGAESAGSEPGQNCLACERSIASTYYALGDKLLCPECCAQVTAPPSGTSVMRLLKASLMGLGAGLVGALIWFAIRRLAHLEIGLVAILVGFMVGMAVRKGSGGRGGLGYQVLAVVLTYCCIAANYMPDIFEGLLSAAREQREADVQAANDAETKTARDPNNRPPHAAAPANAGDDQLTLGETIGGMALLLWFVFKLALAAPFLAGAQNAIGLLIIGFALWEAWKLSARQALPITGPYQMAPGPAA